MEHHAGDDRCMIVRGDQVVIARWDRETSGDRIQPLYRRTIFQGAPRRGKRHVVMRYDGNEVIYGIHLTNSAPPGAPAQRTPENSLIQGILLGGV